MKKIAITLMALCCTMMLISACGQRPKLAEVGKLAPDFTLVDRQGKTWNLDDLKGQVVFVNFWATWCPPCREEIPSMQTLYTSMPADKFTMLSILYKDNPVVADELATKFGMTFPVLVDPDNKAGLAYGLTGVPETYIIDKKGVLREKFLGPVQWDSTGVKQMLMKYVNQ
ncbi:MAG: TlpA family protein disulfide reductase [Proteobacteria bacterium]|nr:TlpA family protein disulfide reductase [Desulfobulbaceae bacterium]MBU4152588.1 TlpA family protein disulfide reductase [Pseudomonadota bacterium]